jgi:predicted permease
LTSRGAGLGIHGLGRLKPGVSVDQARADMNGVTQNLAAAYPDADKGIGASLVPLETWMLGRVRPFLLVLLAAVGFVLLIACVNVANLLLARSTARSREFAVRLALGASHGRLVRQLLTESVLLSLAGGGLGLLAASWGVQAALGWLPSDLPRAEEIGIDGRVLMFTLAVSLLVGILFGLAPAFKAARAELQETLKEGGRGSSGSRNRAQGVFVLVEMATALVLLVGAGLMIRSLTALWNVNPGFNAHNVMNFGLSLSPSMDKASPDAIRAAMREVNQELEAVPGVQAESLSWGAVPLASDDEDLFWIEGQPKPASTNEMSWSLSYVVQEDYLRVMGIPLKRGRFFTPQDNERAAHVIAVDDVFAEKYFAGQDPIGKHVMLDNKGGRAEIVGIVGHVKQWGLDSDDTESLRAQLYFPFMQLPDQAVAQSWSGTGALVRFDGRAPGIAEAIRRALQKRNSEQVIYGVQTMKEVITETLGARRYSMILLGVFGAVALVLSSVGIYGVISYLVGQRTHEIGIRIALGAQRSDVLRLVLGEGAKMALVGVAIGLVAAFALTRLMANLLFGVSATDPLTFAAVAILLTGVSQAACYIPARRAMKVDPLVALRYE